MSDIINLEGDEFVDGFCCCVVICDVIAADGILKPMPLF